MALVNQTQCNVVLYVLYAVRVGYTYNWLESSFSYIRSVNVQTTQSKARMQLRISN